MSDYSKCMLIPSALSQTMRATLESKLYDFRTA